MASASLRTLSAAIWTAKPFPDGGTAASADTILSCSTGAGVGSLGIGSRSGCGGPVFSGARAAAAFSGGDAFSRTGAAAGSGADAGLVGADGGFVGGGATLPPGGGASRDAGSRDAVSRDDFSRDDFARGAAGAVRAGAGGFSFS